MNELEIGDVVAFALPTRTNVRNRYTVIHPCTALWHDGTPATDGARHVLLMRDAEMFVALAADLVKA